MATETATPPREAPKRKRGRETVGDMIRSLGLVMLIVVPVWFLAQPPSSDTATVRAQDTAGPIADLQRQSPGIPVPGTLPQGWVANAVDPGPDGLRIGWNTPTGHYLEYAGSFGAKDFLPTITGDGQQVGTIQVDGTTWQQWQNDGDATTLVRQVGNRTIAVGGVREDTTLSEIETVAATVKP